MCVSTRAKTQASAYYREQAPARQSRRASYMLAFLPTRVGVDMRDFIGEMPEPAHGFLGWHVYVRKCIKLCQFARVAYVCPRASGERVLCENYHNSDRPPSPGIVQECNTSSATSPHVDPSNGNNKQFRLMLAKWQA